MRKYALSKEEDLVLAASRFSVNKISVDGVTERSEAWTVRVPPAVTDVPSVPSYNLGVT